LTILIFGASGSAGGSVLRVCLAADLTRSALPSITEVRAITRRPLGVAHPKLTEIIHADYLDFRGIENMFAGVDACFYCLGKSVRQVSGEAEYRRITYDYALAAATTLDEQSPDAVFHYISGAGTALDSRFMWARVKVEAEQELIARFEAVCWRPASIDGLPSASEPLAYKLLRPLARVIFQPFRSLYVSGEDIGRAMLVATAEGMRGRIVENAEIRALALSSHHAAPAR
jgi:uncharacterized protein YbjT (DUF2867 family)